MTCSNCNGSCYSPQACHLPERDRAFRPTYEIDGPHRRARRANVTLRLVVAVVVVFILRLIARHFGV